MTLSYIIVARKLHINCNNSPVLINKVHHRTFPVVCNQYDKSYEDLQPNNNASTYHKQQYSAFQIFKTLMRLNAELGFAITETLFLVS